MNQNSGKVSSTEVPVSSVALLHIDELERRLARAKSEKEKLVADMREKDNQLIQTTSDLNLILSYVDEIDAQIYVSKNELLGTDAISVTSSESTTDEDITSLHVKRMVDLISVLTGMKAQLSNKSVELGSAYQKIDELHSGIQALQAKHNHLVIEYKKEREQILELTEEINEKNQEIERLESVVSVMRGKYEEVLESSLNDLESFRGELSDALNQLQTSNEKLASMEASHQKELEHLRSDSEEARQEWSQREEAYQKELADLREAVQQLEIGKREALVRRLLSGSSEEPSSLVDQQHSVLLSSSTTIRSILTMTTTDTVTTAAAPASTAGLNDSQIGGEGWREKEEAYQKELSDLRLAIQQLEEDRQQAILRLQSELDETRSELHSLSRVGSVFSASNHNISGSSSTVHQDEEGLSDDDEEDDHDHTEAVSVSLGWEGVFSPAAVREEQRQLWANQWEREVFQLREKLAADSLRWSEKEQQYLSEISAASEALLLQQQQQKQIQQEKVALEVPVAATAELVASTVTVAKTVAVVETDIPAAVGMTKIGFFFRGVIATASALYVVMHKSL